MKVNIARARTADGNLDDAELMWLAEKAQSYKCIVEVGSYLGRSTIALAENTEGQVFCFDNWKGIQEDHLPVDTRENLFDIFKQNINGLLESGKVNPIIVNHEMTDVIDQILFQREIRPDMVFIDGCHEYKRVKSDIEFWLKRLNGKGLLCGHDILWEGVNIAVKELLPSAITVEGTSIWYVDLNKKLTINDGITNNYVQNIGLVVALPFCGRPVVPEWALALATQNYPLNLSRSFCAIGGVATDIARNKAVEYALEKKSNYIWFLDDDVQPPFFALRQLIYSLEQSSDNTMVSTGIYFSKQDPTEPVIYKELGMGAFWKWKVDTKFEVGGCGAGCMVVKTELFRHLKPPYFKTTDNVIVEGTETQNSGTEDLYFCKKVRDAGFKIVADAKVICNHWDVKTMKVYSMPDDSYPNQKDI